MLPYSNHLVTIYWWIHWIVLVMCSCLFGGMHRDIWGKYQLRRG